MDDDEHRRFARDWIRCIAEEHYTPLKRELLWTTEEFDRAVAEEPELAWQLIFAVIKEDSSPDVLGLLGADLLEDFLSEHGEEFIGKVEEEARRNELFKLALRNVVTSRGMPDDVQARIHAAANPTDVLDEEG